MSMKVQHEETRGTAEGVDFEVSTYSWRRRHILDQTLPTVDLAGATAGHGTSKRSIASRLNRGVAVAARVDGATF